MSIIRSKVPVWIISGVIVGIVAKNFLSQSFPITVVISNELTSWATIILTTAFGYSLINLTIVHGGFIKNRRKGQWTFSIYLLFILYTMAFSGIFGGTTNSVFKWYRDVLYMMIARFMAGLYSFFLVTAAYRAWRIKSAQVGVLMFSAVIILLRNSPLGDLLWPGFGDIGTWILNVVTTGVFRGILIGVSISLVMLAVRTALGLERVIID